MKSIDKLREWVPPTGSWTVKGKPQIRQIADEIEAEIAERYMRLPADADGVPIHVGDVMCSAGIREKGHKVIVSAIFEDGFVEYGSENGLIGPLCQEDWVHVKPRTLEDVLMDAGVSRAAISDVADEIRELLGGDVE